MRASGRREATPTWRTLAFAGPALAPGLAGLAKSPPPHSGGQGCKMAYVVFWFGGSDLSQRMHASGSSGVCRLMKFRQLR